MNLNLISSRCLVVRASTSFVGAASSSQNAARRRIHTTPAVSWNEYENKIFIDRGEDAWRRTKELATFDFRRYRRRYEQRKWDIYNRKNARTMVKEVQRYELIPYMPDFVIIGGGLMGSACAYWIKQRVKDEDLVVVCIECDDTFEKSSTVLSVANFRTHFSMPENVKMSLFTSEFVRNAGEHLKILESEKPHVGFSSCGSLYIATSQQEADDLKEDYEMQERHGAKAELLNKDQLEQKFPFIRFDDAVLGRYGLENEGFIDPWEFLTALREKNMANGVYYIQAKIERFMFQQRPDYNIPDVKYPDMPLYDHSQLAGVVVRPQKTDATPRPIRISRAINCAGAWAGEVAALTGMGTGKELLSIPLPIVKRKRFVFVIHCPDGPGFDMPMMTDPTGVWCRRETNGNLYLCGKNLTPEEDEEIDHSNLDVDYNFFYQKVWPILAQRVPCFQELKIVNAWAGYIDVNTYDGNPIIGRSLPWDNFMICAGLGTNGVQHSMALGRGLMEYFYDGAFREINLRKFSTQRFLKSLRIDEEVTRTA